MRTVCGERVPESSALEDAQQDLAQPPLVVDLDRTLVKTDLLLESLFFLLRKQPSCVFLLPLWMAHGKPWFKHEIARRVSLDVAALPWRTEFVDDLKRQRGEGRSLVLATGSDMRLALEVADHLDLFDAVFASTGNANLCGEAKRDLLVSRFGEKGFDYASSGSRNDRIVSRSARKAAERNARLAREYSPAAYNRRPSRDRESSAGDAGSVFIDDGRHVEPHSRNATSAEPKIAESPRIEGRTRSSLEG